MFKPLILTILSLFLITLIPSSHAALIDRGNGLIYDDDLNVTWLQDANYSLTTMSWDEANTWVSDLVYQNIDSWRLPTSDNCSGNGCTGSEMGHLFYAEGINSSSMGLFTNVKPYYYWSGTENESDTLQAWRFNFKADSGSQGTSSKTLTRYAWAVHDGDVVTPPVAPEPVSSILFLTGGTVLAARRFRKKRLME